jgi:hypothetical protein
MRPREAERGPRLIVIYDVRVAIERNANRAAGRNVIDTLLTDICTHRVVGCRVT